MKIEVVLFLLTSAKPLGNAIHHGAGALKIPIRPYRISVRGYIRHTTNNLKTALSLAESYPTNYSVTIQVPEP
jgi:hypothetical protein